MSLVEQRSVAGHPSHTPSTTPVATARFDDKDPLVQPCNAQCAWGSDAVAEMLRRLDVRYIALVPGSSYRGLHDSLVNYLGNRDPKMMVCLHEEHAVAIAHGYAKVTERPMAVAVHSGVGLMHASMAIYNIWCNRLPVVILGATGPGDAELRRPWIDWIHTAKDQAAIIRNYSKWDDEPRSVMGVIEAVTRAHQIASTQPYGPTYVCLDVALQEQAIEGEVKFPDVERFAPGLPPAPAAEAVEEAARLLVDAKKPVILMGRVSRSESDWQARIDLAEALGAVVLTDMKTSAAFPTEHPLHPIEPRFRPSPAVADILKQADVILSLDWIDLKGEFHQTLGQNAPVPAKVIHCSLDRYVHNGWSMDYYGLPPADLPIVASPDMLVPAAARGGAQAARHRCAGNAEVAGAQGPCPAGSAERTDHDVARSRAGHPRVQEGSRSDDPDLFARLAVRHRELQSSARLSRLRLRRRRGLGAGQLHRSRARAQGLRPARARGDRRWRLRHGLERVLDRGAHGNPPAGRRRQQPLLLQ